MLSFFIGKQIFRQNLKYCVSLTMVVAAAMLACVFLIISVQNLNYELDAFAPLRGQKGVYFSDTGTGNFVDGLVSIKSEEKTYSGYISDKVSGYYNVTATSQKLSFLQFPLLKGRWYNYDASATEIEAVVTEDGGYNVGDAYTTVLNGKEVTLRFVGILPNATGYLSLSGFGASGLSDLIHYRAGKLDNAYDDNRYPLILCGDYLFGDEFLGGTFRLVLFENDIAASDYEKNVSAIQKSAGLSVTVDELFAASEQIKVQQLSLYLPLIVMLSLIGGFSLYIVIKISYVNSGKIIALSYIAGGSFKTRFGAYILFVAEMLLIANATYTAAVILLVRKLFSDGSNFVNIPLVCAVTPIIISFTILFLSSFIVAKSSKERIAKYIKEDKEQL